MEISGLSKKIGGYIDPNLQRSHRTDRCLIGSRQADGFSPAHKTQDEGQAGIFNLKMEITKNRPSSGKVSSGKDGGSEEIRGYMSSIEGFIKELDTHDISEKCKKEVESGLGQIIKDAKDIENGLQTREVFHGEDNLKSALKSTSDRISRLKVKKGKIGDIDIERSCLNSPIPNFGEVEKGVLYRGAQPSKAGLQWLAKKGVKAIVNLREVGREDEYGYTDFNRKEEKRMCEELGIKYVEIDIKDRTLPTQEDVHKYLDNFDSKETQPVFIHCAAGVGRTGIMAGLFRTNKDGWKADDAIREAGNYGFQPNVKPDHKIQADFIRTNETLPPRNPVLSAFAKNKGITQKHTLQDTSRMWEDIEASALCGYSYEIDGNEVTIDGKTYFVNAHDPEAYKADGEPFPARNPEDLHPAPLVQYAKEKGVFLKFDFKTPSVIEKFAQLGEDIPPHRKMGHAFVKELVVEGTELASHEKKDLSSIAQVDKAKKLLDDAPFQVSCKGVTLENLDHDMVDRLAGKVKGHAEILNFNLPNHQNPPLKIAKYLWEKYGLVTEIKIGNQKDKKFWDKAGIPYFGSSDNREYATSFTKHEDTSQPTKEQSGEWLIT